MATQIKKFTMGTMTVAATSLFHQRFINLVKNTEQGVLHIEDKMSPYEEASATLAGVVNRQRAFVSTVKLKDADVLRDTAGGIVTSGVQLHLNSPIPTKREAAILAWAKLSPYRRIRNHAYAKQTAEVQGMLAVLREPEVAAAMELLGFTEEVEILARANDTFLEALDLRVTEKGEQMEQSELKSKELMDLANSLYEGIIQVINAYAILHPTEALMAFVKEANGLVGTFSDFSNTGISGGSAADGGDGFDEPTPDDGGSEGETPSEGDNPSEGDTPEGGTTPPPTTGGNDDDEEVVG